MSGVTDIAFTMHGRMGDFWTEKFKGDSLTLLRALSGLPGHSGTLPTLISGMQTIAGATAGQWAGKHWEFTADSVIVIGPNLQQRIRTLWNATGFTSGYVLQRVPEANAEYPIVGYTPIAGESLTTAGGVSLMLTENMEYWLFPGNGGVQVLSPKQNEVILKYAVPIPAGYFPTSLRNSKGKEFTLGVDYNQSGNLLMFNSEHPDKLFPNRCIIAPAGWENTEGPLNYTLGLDQVPTTPFVAEYLRNNQSAPAWLRALAAASGFSVAVRNSVVCDVDVRGVDTFYTTTDGEVIKISYPHHALASGSVINRGDIIGSPLRIFYMRNAADTEWWAQLNIGQGLNMDGLCPFKGIVMPNYIVGARYLGPVGGTGTSHPVDFPLLGNAESITKFWYAMRRNELLTGNFINSAIGVTSTSGPKGINPTRLMFDYALTETLWVVERYQFPIWPNAIQVKYNQFINAERPFGSIVINTDIS